MGPSEWMGGNGPASRPVASGIRGRPALRLRQPAFLSVLFLSLFLGGCAALPDGRNVPDDVQNYAYRNEPLTVDDTAFRAGEGGATIATSDIPWRVPAACRRDFRGWLSTEPQPVDREDDWLARGHCRTPPKKAFMGVAITGGGNKSAVYAAEVLFELERYGLAEHIDVLSSVSGGSFTAALYALSCDRGDLACPRRVGEWRRPVWDYAEISERLESNYLWPFIGRRLLPNHLYLNVATHHGSADDMADIVGGRLFQEQGGKLRFADLNPGRPNLILNATNTTQDRAALDQDASIPPERKRPLSDDDALHFAFTQQYFWRLLSRLDSYPLADAVVASAAFPLLIDRPSLRMFRHEDLEALRSGGPMRTPSYVSLYDGGVHDNFGLTELRWFVECQFDRNARRTTWTPDIRERICGRRDPPRIRPAATLIVGINSSLLRTEGVKPELPKPRSWDSYLGPVRLTGTAQSVDMIMAASGELRKMELRSLVEEVSRMSAGAGARAPNPFLAPGRHQYVDIDLEAAYYMSCPKPVGMDGAYAGFLGMEVPLNAANGSTERRRCEALIGVLKWNAPDAPDGRNLQLPTAPPRLCHDDDCAALDGVLGGRADAAPRPRLFETSAPVGGPRLLHNQALFNALRDVPTNFELSSNYVRLLRYAARWAVAHRIWELCVDHPDLLDQLPHGRKPVCVDRLPERAVNDNPT